LWLTIKHAGPCDSDKQRGGEKLTSSVPYSLSATQDILGALAEYEAGTIAPRPAELDSCDGSLDFMDDVEHSAQVIADNSLSDHDRIVRLEKAVVDERDIFDRLRDMVEDLEVQVGDLTKWKQDVMDNRCSRCHGKSDPAHADRNKKNRNLGPTRAGGTSTVPVSVAGPSKGTLPSAPTGPRPAVSRRAIPRPAVSPRPVVSRPTVSRPGIPRPSAPPTAAVTPAVAPSATPAAVPRLPTYANSDEARATRSFAAVAATDASAEGYKIVTGRKRYITKKDKTPVPSTSIPGRAHHLTIGFERARDTKYSLPVGATVGKIRESLNAALIALNCRAYFSEASLSKWGDVLLTLAATEVETITGYYPAMREALDIFDLGTFTFVRDTEKVKVFVGMVPLSRFGGGWNPSDWEGSTAFDCLAADIENSNPGIIVAARPSWAGCLHKLKERRVNNAGLILVLELTTEVRAMMGAAQPRINVAGRHGCAVHGERTTPR